MNRLLIFIFALTFLQEGMAKDWFQYDGESNTYSIYGEDVRPAAFFQSLSWHSGIQVRYEKSLVEGLFLNFRSEKIENILRYIDKEYSTLKSYKKDSSGKSKLTEITILPKGQFKSDQLVLALDPIDEVVASKQGKRPLEAENVYVTRFESLEIKVKKHFNEMAENRIAQEEFIREKNNRRRSEYKDEKERLVLSMKELKEKDPSLYQHKLKVNSWKYPDLEKSINHHLQESKAE